MSDNANFRIVSLDGIRAVAALIVFLSHAGVIRLVPGGFGVAIFFFLSGYLITTLLRQEFEERHSISFGNFYLRRAFRIFPPLYIVLLLLTLAPLAGSGLDTSGLVIAGQFAQLTNYIVAYDQHQIIPLSGAMWSLSVEEHFYLLFPLAFLGLLRRFSYRRIATILLGVCGAVLLWRCVLVYGFGIGEPYTYVATDARIDSLLFGCVMAVGFNPALDKECLAWSPWVWVCALVLACGLVLFTLIYRNPNFLGTIRYTLQGIAFVPFFFCAIRYVHWPVFRWLEHRLMRAMGLISYTFYLVHQAIIHAIGHNMTQGPIVKALLSFALSMAASAAMYYLVERQFARLRRRLHQRLNQVPPGAGAGVALSNT